jgi:very-short-patch-repair endonuclease
MSQDQESKTFLRARILRRNLTAAEKILWARLRSHRLDGAGFLRQHPLGSFIVDFCAPRKKVIIELDGEQHAYQKEYDSARSEYLKDKGYIVLRFWNNDVLRNIDGVMDTIRKAIDSREKG